MRDQIREAFLPLHASEYVQEEVLKMANSEKNIHPSHKVGKGVLIAVALAAMLMVTAFAADYVVNHREVFFFDTMEALGAQQTAGNPDTAASCEVPGTAKENEDMETPAQYVERIMEGGMHGDETIVSREGGDFEKDGWEYRMTTTCDHDFYGDVIGEYCTAGEYANRIFIEDVIDWDVSYLSDTMVPEENGQIIASYRDAEDGDLVLAEALLGYRTGSGKRFQVFYSYNTFFDHGQETEYILNSAYDSVEVFVTQDQIEVVLKEYDGQIWAEAANGYQSVSIYTTGCTMEEMKDILNHIDLVSAVG